MQVDAFAFIIHRQKNNTHSYRGENAQMLRRTIGSTKKTQNCALT